MYKVIQLGGSRIGGRRGCLFARDFKRDMSIPVGYGIDKSDSYLLNFLNTYLDYNSNIDFDCYVNYFHKNDTDALIVERFSDIYEELCISNGCIDDKKKDMYQKIHDVLCKKLKR